MIHVVPERRRVAPPHVAARGCAAARVDRTSCLVSRRADVACPLWWFVISFLVSRRGSTAWGGGKEIEDDSFQRATDDRGSCILYLGRGGDGPCRDGCQLVADAKSTLATYQKTDPGVTAFIERSAGYVVFPSVIKGGIGIGGAHGSGVAVRERQADRQGQPFAGVGGGAAGRSGVLRGDLLRDTAGAGRASRRASSASPRRRPRSR